MGVVVGVVILSTNLIQIDFTLSLGGWCLLGFVGVWGVCGGSLGVGVCGGG